MEGDHITSLCSHGQMLEQICCFPRVLCDAGDVLASFLCELDSHVVPYASCLSCERVEDTDAGLPSILICLGLSRLVGCRPRLAASVQDVGLTLLLLLLFISQWLFLLCATLFIGRH